jgi:hypothetical protein
MVRITTKGNAMQTNKYNVAEINYLFGIWSNRPDGAFLCVRVIKTGFACNVFANRRGHNKELQHWMIAAAKVLNAHGLPNQWRNVVCDDTKTKINEALLATVQF